MATSSEDTEKHNMMLSKDPKYYPIIREAAESVQRKLPWSATHDEIVDKFCDELITLGLTVGKERLLRTLAGNLCKPDIDIIENGKSVVHIEVKHKRKINQDNRAQANKYTSADGIRVYMVNFFKVGGPSIRPFSPLPVQPQVMVAQSAMDSTNEHSSMEYLVEIVSVV